MYTKSIKVEWCTAFCHRVSSFSTRSTTGVEEMYVEDRGIWSRESETLGSEAFLETNVGMLTEIGRKRERALGRTGSGVWRRKINLAN